MEKAAQWPSPSSLLRGCVLKVSKPPWKTHIVPDIDVRAFGQQQLHQVHMLVLSGPDHRRPTTIILSIRDKRYHQTANRRKTSCSLLREFAQGTVFWQVKGGTWLPPKAQSLHNRGGRLTSLFQPTLLSGLNIQLAWTNPGRIQSKVCGKHEYNVSLKPLTLPSDQTADGLMNIRHRGKCHCLFQRPGSERPIIAIRSIRNLLSCLPTTMVEINAC